MMEREFFAPGGGVAIMRIAVALVWLAFLPLPAVQAHYNMLLPASAFASRDRETTLTYQFGHPFEHQLFDAPKPSNLTVRTPDGKTTVLTDKFTRLALPGEKDRKVVGYRLRYTPEQRGDHVFVLQTAPIWLEDGYWVEDTVKVVLHVESEKGWDGKVNPDFEWRPITRPYGLLPGTVFQAGVVSLEEAKAKGTTFSGVVEVERYNEAAPAELPAEEFITRTVRTERGVVTTTLPEAGWWCLTASRDGGMKEHEGKSRPVRRRTTLWVYVHEKAPGK
jgi:uncharacterized GH25 family protein